MAFWKGLFQEVEGETLFSTKNLKEFFQWVIIIMAVINSWLISTTLGKKVIPKVVLKSPNYFWCIPIKKMLTL